MKAPATWAHQFAAEVIAVRQIIARGGHQPDAMPGE
jgi:hypothetical protein